MDFFDRILKLPKYHRRAFIALLLAICLILGLLDQLVLEDTASSVHFLSHYVQSIVEALIVGLFVLWLFVAFTPYSEGQLEQLEPYRITPQFDQMLKNAQRWRYKGNFGRYERGRVLPVLASKQNAHASISIIDPRNEKLCREHAEYRNKIQAVDKGRVYDADLVALEVVVTIVHCAWYVAKRTVDIDLYLSSVFDPLRIDSNDDAMILTVEDRRSPALMLTKQHFMYAHFEQHMLYAREQGVPLKLDGLTASDTVAALSDKEIEDFLNKIGMGGLCERLTAKKIATASRASRNPYEN
ncbi:MAG TPA: hypothetical protein VN655_05215 [Pseudolabrys sp.]|nr:hypothetical protein [Pseudolabrys sp.]